MGVDEVRRSDKFEYNITTRSLGPSHLATGSSSPPRMGIRSTSYPTWRKKSWPRPDVLAQARCPGPGHGADCHKGRQGASLGRDTAHWPQKLSRPPQNRLRALPILRSGQFRSAYHAKSIFMRRACPRFPSIKAAGLSSCSATFPMTDAKKHTFLPTHFKHFYTIDK